jgi:glycosyltransferase involved in cell wall biosynthesis
MHIGGAERSVYQLIREQRKRGLAADVLVGSRAGFYGERAREEGATVYELGQKSALDLAGARRAGSIMQRYEVAHFHGVEPLLMEVARRKSGAFLAYTHRGGVRSYSMKKRARHWLVARCLGNFDALSANTKQSARAASQIFGLPIDRFKLVYNGVDFSLLQPVRSREDVLSELGIAPGELIVGTSAKLIPWKRIDRLVRAVAALKSLPFHCLIIGDGPERARLARLATDLGIAERVEFTGLQTRVGDYLQVLGVFVLPSGPAEAFGNAVVEAMGAGVPSVVFADGGGLPEHIEDGATGFVVADEGDFERRLRELLCDAALRSRIGEAGQASVRGKYTLEAMIKGYEAFYRSNRSSTG